MCPLWDEEGSTLNYFPYHISNGAGPMGYLVNPWAVHHPQAAVSPVWGTAEREGRPALAVAGVKTVHSGCSFSAPQSSGEEQPGVIFQTMAACSPKLLSCSSLCPCTVMQTGVFLLPREVTVAPLPSEYVFPGTPLPKKQECSRGQLPRQFL